MLTPSDRAGRQTAVRSGYLGNLKAGDRITAVQLHLADREQLAPGQGCLATLRLPNWSYVAHLLDIGSEFELVEGPRRIADGRVVGNRTPGIAEVEV